MDGVCGVGGEMVSVIGVSVVGVVGGDIFNFGGNLMSVFGEDEVYDGGV